MKNKDLTFVYQKQIKIELIAISCNKKLESLKRQKNKNKKLYIRQKQQ